MDMDNMVEVEIFLSVNGAQISFLSIPRSDVQRLAEFPFRWIRYVMFAICGARGDLSSTPDGDPVDYDSIGFTNDENTYYYRPSDAFAFVDQEGLNDKITSTALTPRRSNFRTDIMRRDGDACVVSQESGTYCDAAHLIPWSKGHEYIERVVQLRSPGDNSALPLNVEINDIVNGMLLDKVLHSALAFGDVAFIKTPNYGLRPEDIKRFHRGGPRPGYITLHRLRKPENYDPALLATLQNVHPSVALALGANVDALFQGEGGSPPSTLILDYVYGVAAYRRWRSNHADVPILMNNYREEHYAHIPPPSIGSPDDTSPELDDPTDHDLNPSDPDLNPSDSHQKRYTLAKRRDGISMAEAMDEMNLILMLLSGTTPEQVAEGRQKQIEQEERAAQEASRSKVMEWRKHMDVDVLH